MSVMVANPQHDSTAFQTKCVDPENLSYKRKKKKIFISEILNSSLTAGYDFILGILGEFQKWICLYRTLYNLCLFLTYTTFLSCFSSLLVNSFRISKNSKQGGGADGSSATSTLFCTANRIPALCKTIIASRFLTASKPNESANRLANSCST